MGVGKMITLEKLIELRKAIMVILKDIYYVDWFEVPTNEMNEYLEDKLDEILHEVKIRI